MKALHSARWLLLALLLCLVPATSYAGVFISVGYAPPPLPVYAQPMCPGPGLIWTPGYWAYGPEGYYWVPGAWVPAPFVGALWTPGYWGWSANLYVWHPGYWGRTVGYYGGVNYGFGYFGIGFVGGRWRNGFFDYNRAVWRVNTRVIRNTYYDNRDFNRYTVVRDGHVAYNGGPGGIRYQPNAQERMAEREQHMERTSFQAQHAEAAMRDRNAYARFNGGRPRNLVTDRPLGRESRPAPQARQMERPQGRQNPQYEQNRQQPQQQRRQQEQRQQPQYRRQPQQQRPQPENRPPQYRQQPQYREQQYRQPQYRQQQYRQTQRTAPQFRRQTERRAQPQGRAEQRGRGQSRPQHDNHGRRNR